MPTSVMPIPAPPPAPISAPRPFPRPRVTPWWARHALTLALGRRLLGREARASLKMFRLLKYWPDLRHPLTMNEKIVHRCLHENDPRFAICADKIAVRDWVAARVGPEVLIPLLGAYRRVQDIPWQDLQPPFVMKGTHGSTWVRLVPRGPVDVESLQADAARWLAMRYRGQYERWYERMPRGVLFERMLAGPGGEADPAWDYKFWTFGGRVKIIQVDSDRFIGHKRVLYSRDWEPLPYRIKRAPAPPQPPPPALPRLLEVAETLARGFDFVRVDLYCPDGEAVYFGEMTFAPGAGLNMFTPIDRDLEVGGYWEGEGEC